MLRFFGFDNHTFATRIPVQGGDILGSTMLSLGAGCDYAAAPGDFERIVGGDPAPGNTVTFGSSFPSTRINVSAVVEPDCDNDGFGDETQDTDLSACPPGPVTTITAGPKDKTKKKQATFEFTADDAGATFGCSLDGGAFAACSSPDALKVKKGKHHFEVRAADAGGNVGPAATDTWKVKKKKKKK